MARLRGRAFEQGRDLEAVVALLVEWRVAGHLEEFLTPWRLRLLVTSRLLDLRNARVWEDGAGRLVGFCALLQRQPGAPGLGLEYVMRPGREEPGELGEEVAVAALSWALERAGEIAGELGQEVTIGYGATHLEAAERARLQRFGFSWPAGGVNVVMCCTLDGPLPEPAMPEGFTLREFGGAAEIGAYLTVYNTTSSPLQDEHVRALIAGPGYDRALDLVAQAPDGRFAAFCQASYNAEEWARAAERVGWIEHVGTHPELERRGLGRALTLEALRRLQAAGAQSALLVTRGDNEPAQRVYAALGFGVIVRSMPGVLRLPPSE